MLKKRYLILYRCVDSYFGNNCEILSVRDFDELKNLLSFDWRYNCLSIIGIYDITSKISLKGRLNLC